MVDSRFFNKQPATALKHLAELSGCTISAEGGNSLVHDVAPLERAGAEHVSFFDNVKYKSAFAASNAGFCVVKEKYAALAPKGMALLISADPYRAYALIANYFYPQAAKPAFIAPSAVIAATATIGAGCHIAAHVVIGEHVSIGDGCVIDANTVIDDGVLIGNNSRIGALCSLSHCIIGNDVLLHRGVHVGQDGFGFAMGAGGHVKVPQLGRVIIGNNVEIGSGTTIDRGASPDTIISDGARIDNLVQIAHNVQIGKHVVIAAQCGIAGSAIIGDYAVLGGQVGVAGHLNVGAGVMLAAKSGVTSDIPAGQTYGGIPAIPVKDWHRSHIQLKRLSTTKKASS